MGVDRKKWNKIKENTWRKQYLASWEHVALRNDQEEMAGIVEVGGYCTKEANGWWRGMQYKILTKTDERWYEKNDACSYGLVTKVSLLNLTMEVQYTDRTEVIAQLKKKLGLMEWQRV